MSVIDKREYLFALYSRLRQYGRVTIGRVLGTVASTKGSYKFFIDAEESRLFHRAELNAIVKVLHDKGVVKSDEWEATVIAELEQACKDNADKWPEAKVEWISRGALLAESPFASFYEGMFEKIDKDRAQQ